MEENTDPNNTEDKPIRDERGLFLPGNPGSPGRPKGKTLKEWAREKLMQMDDTERMKFLKTMPRDIIWKMAEGMPAQDTKHSGEVILISVSKEGAEKYGISTSSPSDNPEGHTPV